MTRCLFELQGELLSYFKKSHDFQTDLRARVFLISLFIGHIRSFEQLGLSFQGPNRTVMEFMSMLEALIRKLDLSAENVKN